MRHFDVEDDDRVVVIEKQSIGIGPLLLGVAIGAGIALLLAPQSGAATRRGIERRARRATRAARRVATGVAETVVESFDGAKRRVEEQIDGAREAIDAKAGQVRRAMDAGRAGASQARLDLEERLAQTKAAYRAGAEVARESRREASRAGAAAAE